VAQLFSLGSMSAMKTLTQRYLGLLLIFTSVLAAAICFVIFPHRFFAEHTSPSGPTFFGFDSGLSWYYVIPILVCAAVGVFFLTRSSRKPPKLPR
jgi:hypothetical protein